MELFYPVDTAIVKFNGTDMSPRLPRDEIAELQSQMNVNLSDGCDDWFDEPEQLSPDMHIVDEAEFFDRFCN